MRHEIHHRAGGANRPGELTLCHRQRVDQHPCAMADVLMFAAFAPARLGRFGWGCAFQNLHPGFFIAADHQTTLLIVLQGFDLGLAKSVEFSIEVLIVPVVLVFTPVRFEISVLENTKDAGAAGRDRVWNAFGTHLHPRRSTIFGDPWSPGAACSSIAILLGLHERPVEFPTHVGRTRHQIDESNVVGDRVQALWTVPVQALRNNVFEWEEPLGSARSQYSHCELGCGLKSDHWGDLAWRTTCGIGVCKPEVRQKQPLIQEGIAMAGGICSTDATLTVLDLAERATILPGHADHVLALCGEA
jgi:hypothetical protein